MHNLTVIYLFLSFCCVDLLAQEADCELIEHENPDSEIDPLFEEICTYKNIKTRAIGTPDYKGRYSWDHELFLLTNSKERQLQLTEVFGRNADRVKQLLNDQLKNEYQSNLAEPELSDCIKTIDFRTFGLNEFRLDFLDGDLINFWVEYGTGSACFNVNLGLATLTYEQFNKLAEITSHNKH